MSPRRLNYSDATDLFFLSLSFSFILTFLLLWESFRTVAKLGEIRIKYISYKGEATEEIPYA